MLLQNIAIFAIPLCQTKNKIKRDYLNWADVHSEFQNTLYFNGLLNFSSSWTFRFNLIQWLYCLPKPKRGGIWLIGLFRLWIVIFTHFIVLVYVFNMFYSTLLYLVENTAISIHFVYRTHFQHFISSTHTTFGAFRVERMIKFVLWKE